MAHGFIEAAPRGAKDQVSASATLEDMKQVLETLNPASTSAALHALGEVFPAVPLRLRVDACQLYAQSCILNRR